MLTKVIPNKQLPNALAAYVRNLKKSEEKTQKVPLLPIDPKLPFCIIIDIDQTLAIRGNRGIFEFEKALEDTINPYLVQLLIYLSKGRDPNYFLFLFFFTGREGKYREVTTNWLHKNNIAFDQLYMRETGDLKTKAADLKENLYITHIAHKYNVLCAIDDDLSVIDKFQSLGIYTMLVDPQ